MTQDVEKIFKNLPPGFFGEVVIGFKNGQPYYAKVSATHNFERKTSLENRVDNNANRR